MKLKPTLPSAWRRAMASEIKRQTATGLLIADVEEACHHLPGFGLVVSINGVPPGTITDSWIDSGDGPLLSPAGERLWNALLTLAHETVDFCGAPGDLAAVVLQDQAFNEARAARAAVLSGEKREAA